MTAQGAVAAIVDADWRWREFQLTPEAYDSLLLEPVAFPAISSLACAIVTTEEATTRLNQSACALYCDAVIECLKQKRFTECGGLWLKKVVREAQEVLVKVLGDEMYGLLEMRKLRLFAILVSLPIDVLDVSSVCASAQIELPEEELSCILSLRVSDVQ